MNAKLIREALDTLAVALADYGHTWSDEERRLYEKAVRECTKETDRKRELLREVQAAYERDPSFLST